MAGTKLPLPLFILGLCIFIYLVYKMSSAVKSTQKTDPKVYYIITAILTITMVAGFILQN